MLKVFLVENEKAIRDEIRKGIAWEENGLCLAGEAGDGETAYEKIMQTKPDILITDIAMPSRDDLELSELIKKELPNIKIIIISRFDQFIYASKALRIGVMDYLMKPVDVRRLLDALLETKRDVEEQQHRNRYMDLLKLEMREKERMKKGIFLGELILGYCDQADIQQRSRELQIDLSAKAYNLILFQYWKEKQNQREEIWDERVEEKLSRCWKLHTEVICFDRGTEGRAILWKRTKGSDSSLENLVKELEEIFEKEPEFRYFIGVGKEVSRLENISECYHEANKAFAGRFFFHSKCVAFSDAPEKAGEKEKPAYGKSSLKYDISKVDKERFQNFLKNGNRLDIKAFIEEYCRQMGRANMQTFLFRQYVLMDCSFSAIHLVEKLKGDAKRLRTKFSDAENILNSAASVEKTKRYLQALLNLYIEIRDGINENKSKILLAKGKEYMEEHYGDEDISLNTVAAYLNVSPNHLSRIFSQQEEKTFVECLTEIRMNRAKEMLRCTGLKATEISRRLGYKDHHYFYYLFKKTVGCTPRDYRMRNVS